MSLRNFFFIVLLGSLSLIQLIESVPLRHDSDIDGISKLFTKKIKVFWINDNSFYYVSKHWTDILTKTIGYPCSIKTIRNRDLKINRFFEIQLHRDNELIIKLKRKLCFDLKGLIRREKYLDPSTEKPEDYRPSGERKE